MYLTKAVAPYLSCSCFYPKNTMLKHEGDACDEIGIVMRGTVEMHHYSETGEVSLLASIQENEVFGDVLILSDEPYYIGTLMSTQTCEVKYLSKQNLETLLKSNETFRDWFIKQLANKAMMINRHQKILHQKTLQAKVLYYLHLQQTTTKNKKVYLPSHEQFAQILNVQRPSLSRCLSDMKKQGLIDYKNRYYWVL